MTNPLKSLIPSLAALALVGGAVSPAFAANPERMTIKVSTADIDLGTAKGQRTLYLRVEKAVRSVCRTTSLTTGSRMLSMDAQACLAKARSDAKRQVAVLMETEQRGG